MRPLRAIAVDLGATSCRVTQACWDGGAAHPQVAHRFANGAVARAQGLFWDLGRLEQGIEYGLRACVTLLGAGDSVDSAGVSGWAADYVRLGHNGRALADPFCYRDPRTETAMPQVWERIPRERLYELTGVQMLGANTLYQLYADCRDGLDPGAGWLNIPEYVLYRLAGNTPEAAVSEHTNSTHTQLLDARSETWSGEVFARTGLDCAGAPRLVSPGTVLGGMAPRWQAHPLFRRTQLIAPACHDTGAAVAGVPEPPGDWAFISSGTWSLVGTLLYQPCITPAAMAANLTNEGGLGSTVRLIKNINGLWLLEECRRQWQKQGREWSIPKLLTACEAASPQHRDARQAIFDVDAAELLLPGDMPAKINRALLAAGRPPLRLEPEHAPAVALAIFASLAAHYARALRMIEAATGLCLRRIYMIGGGSQNEILNRMVADATGLEIHRGPVESSTIGNLAIQFAVLESGSANPAAVAAWAERLGRANTTTPPL